MRCGRCGNENSEGNRFCGMCGAALVPTAQAPIPVAPSTERRAVPVGAPEESRIPARSTNEAFPVMAPPIVTTPAVNPPAAPSFTPAAPIDTPPIIIPAITTPAAPPRAESDRAVYGPSFLGLNRPPDGRSRDGLQRNVVSGHEPHRPGNLDYLLEDEEEPKRGWGKLVVVVIALGLIGGFGYLRWKQGGFNFLKPAAATQSQQKTPDSAGAPNTNGATPGDAAPSAANPSPASQTASPANSGTTTAAPASPDAAASGGAVPGAGAPPSGMDAGTQPPASSVAAPAASAVPDNSSPGKPQENAAAEKSSASDSGEDAEAGPAKSESHAPIAAAKPSPARTRERKPTPVTPVDISAEAERYIYGRGVAQDCDQGLRLLKPAAAQANSKAMIMLGTLYSSGTCTPRDLPTAYRWYALALHKEPDNQTLQDDLQQLWSQMTPPERQLAIKLSQ